MEEVKQEEPASAAFGGGPNIIGNKEDLSEGEPGFQSAKSLLFDPNQPAASFGHEQAHEKGVDADMYKEIIPKRTAEQEYRMQRRNKNKEQKDK